MQIHILIYIALAFIVGLLCGSILPDYTWLWGGLMCVCFSVALMLSIKNKGLKGSHIVVPWIVLTVIFGGWFRMSTSYQSTDKVLSSLPWYTDVSLQGTVVEISPDRDSIDVQFAKIKVDATNPYLSIPNKYKFSVALDTSLHVAAGDVLHCQATLIPLKARQSPIEVDFRAISLRKHIIGELYLKSVSKISHTELPFRDRAIGEISKSLSDIGLSRSYVAFTMALVLGDKSSIDPSTKLDYQLSGVMHLLVVSGLHVGIVVAILMLLTAPIGKRKVIRGFVVLGFIWGYAYLVGFTAPVSRASVMFSVLLISGMISGKYVSVNSLAISALINLVIRPEDVLSVGFQMSYWASFAIVSLCPMMYRRMSRWHYVWRFTGMMIGVSVVAQLALLPFMLYYFDYINILSPLANLLLVPLVTYILLPMGIVMVGMSLCCIGVPILVRIYETLISLANSIASGIASSEVFAFDDFGMSAVVFAVLWTVVLGVILMLNRSLAGVYVVLVGCVVGCVAYIAIPEKYPYIAYEQRNILLVSSANHNDTLTANNSVEIAGSRYIVCPTKETVLPEAPYCLVVDKYLLVDNVPQSLIILPSAKVGEVLKWMEYAKEKNISVYNVREKGFLSLDK